MLKENIAEKKFWSSEKSARAGRCLAIGVSEEQGFRRWQLGCSVKSMILEIKITPRKTRFLEKSSQKTRLKFFRAGQMSRKHWADSDGFWKPHTRGINPGDKSRGKFSQRQILLKKMFYI